MSARVETTVRGWWWRRTARWTLTASMLMVPLQAGADTLLGGNIGYFTLRGENARAPGDVLVENLGFLTFDLRDFNHVSAGGELLVGLGDFVEAGLGASFYQRKVPSIYTRFVDSDGTEVDQDLELKVAPVTFTARMFPLGRRGAVQPYLGGGLAILAWRYRETGEFVDFDNRNRIFTETFEDKGNQAAPVVLGGVRFPIGDSFLVGGEFRWQGGKARLDPSQGFAGDRIDLGGYTTQAVFHLRF